MSILPTTGARRSATLLAAIAALSAGPGSAPAQPCTGTAWTPLESAGPGPRAKHTVVFDSIRARAVIFGGFDGTRHSDTWELGGVGPVWSLVGATGPVARQSHAMAFDRARARTVLFGGNGSATAYLGDTWEYNGSTWAQRTTAVQPGARYWHAMAYDQARAQTVLFGGYDGALKGDTWTWDGNTWTQRSAGGGSAPTARYLHAMAYDAARSRIILFGGYDGALRADTWEWDGAAWSQRATSGPTARSGHTMAYDSGRARVALFGGHDGAYRADLWEWDGGGGAWAPRASGSPAPTARTASTMCFDDSRRVFVLQGGITANSGTTYTYAGDTWTRSEPAPAIIQQPASLTVNAGQSAAFVVVVSGSGPLSYQWRKGGLALAGGERSLGTTTPTLTIDPVMLGPDAGPYDVVITGPCGTIISATAILTVICRPDWNGDAHLDPQDVSAFLAAWYSSATYGVPGGDFDRNGTVEPADVAAFIASWMAALGGSCPP